MLVVFFTQDFKVENIENMSCVAPSGSEPSLFFSNYLSAWVQDDSTHGFVLMADEANNSVVLVRCRLPFIESIIISD